jgi:hypothetical protein
MLSMTLRFEGTRALLMHNARLADPTHEMTAALRQTRQQARTEATFEQMRRLEWFGGLVTDQHNKPALSEDMVLAAGVAGAAFTRRVEAMRGAVLGMQPFFPLEYEGPKDLDALYAGGRHVDYRSVMIDERKRVMRTRPRFDSWAVTVPLLVDETVIDPRDVQHAFEMSGRLVGIGDFRPRFGRFTVELMG